MVAIMIVPTTVASPIEPPRTVQGILENIPCEEEIQDLVEAVGKSDIAATAESAEGVVACVAAHAQAAVCLLANQWVNDSTDTLVDYQQYLLEMAIRGKSVALLAEALPTDHGDLFHREVFLTVGNCGSSDAGTERIAWSVVFGNGRVTPPEPKAMAMWTMDVPS